MRIKTVYGFSLILIGVFCLNIPAVHAAGYYQKKDSLQIANKIFKDAVTLYEEGKNDEALHFFKEALTYYIKLNKPSQTATALESIGLAFSKKNLNDSARSYLNQAIATGLATARTYYILVQVLFIQEKKYDEAIQIAKNGLSRYADNADLKKALKIMLMEKGALAYGAQQFEQAIASYRDAVLCDSANAEAHAYLAFSYFSNANYVESLKSFNRSIQLDSTILSKYPVINQMIDNIKYEMDSTNTKK
jgi:tetratricopeptide (TPR) repeat protein